MTHSNATSAPIAFGISTGPRNPEQEAANLETARRYLAAIEASTESSTPDTTLVESFYSADVVQEEFPNRFDPSGATRDLAGIRAAAERGRGVLKGQRYEVRDAYAFADTVILEVLWVGTLARTVGALNAGQHMRAHFAVFLEFRDGKIVRQRNYDCFEQF